MGLLEVIYIGCMCRHHETGGKFSFRKGGRQGDSISLKLFIACPEAVLEALLGEAKDTRREYFSPLIFVDGIEFGSNGEQRQVK